MKAAVNEEMVMSFHDWYDENKEAVITDARRHPRNGLMVKVEGYNPNVGNSFVSAEYFDLSEEEEIQLIRKATDGGTADNLSELFNHLENGAETTGEYDFPTHMPYAVPPSYLTLEDGCGESHHPSDGVLNYRIRMEKDEASEQMDIVVPGWGDHLPLFWSADKFNNATPESWEGKSAEEAANNLLYHRDKKYGEDEFDYFAQVDEDGSEYLIEAFEATAKEIESQHPENTQWGNEIRDYRSVVDDFFE